MITVNRIALATTALTWSDIEAHGQTYPDQKLYAIVDGAIDRDYFANLQKNGVNDTWQSLYADLPEGNSPEVTPFLLSLDLSINPRAQVLFERLMKPYYLKLENCIIVWSQCSLSHLCEHLGQYAQIKTADSQRALLRYHDPNIVAAALAVQTDHEQMHFFAGVNEVWSPDLDQQMWRYSFDGPREADVSFQAIKWDQARHARFTELTQPRKILLYLESEHAEKITGSRVAWQQKIQNWIVHANTLGATSPSELKLYCVSALFAGEKFYQAPEVSNELSEMGKRHADFTQTIQAVAPEVWERLANEQLMAQ